MEIGICIWRRRRIVINSEESHLEKFTAPYGREISLENVAYENGMRVLRVHIREGNRHTVMDIDDTTAAHWGAAMLKWSNQGPQE
jgi:hypothetical protein